jgi:hypothetical protein
MRLRERNTAFPSKTPASIFYKREMGYTKLICNKVDKRSSFMRVPVAHSVFIMKFKTLLI